MEPQKLLQLAGGGAPVVSPKVDLRQRQLWIGEVRRVQLFRNVQVLDTQIELAQEGVVHSQLRVRQCILGPAQRRLQIEGQRLVRLTQRQQHAAQVDQR